MKGQVKIPESSEELEELLNDDGRMSDVSGSPELLAEFTQKYQGAWKAKNTEAIREMREKMQVDYQDFVRAHTEQGSAPRDGFRPGAGGGARGPLTGRDARRARAAARSSLRNAADEFGRQGLFNADAVGAGADIDDSPYAASLQKFLWATLKGEILAAQTGDDAAIGQLRAFKGGLENALVRNATTLSERIPSEGGFLVPETLRSEVLALSLEDEIMKPRATVVPMDSLTVPFPSVDDTSHASSVFGGVAAGWTAEGAALNATAPKFARVKLTANKLTAYTEIPSELLQDSVTPMDVWFRTFFPQAIAFFRDLAYLTGDGVDQPEGIINAPGAVTVDPAVSNAISFIDIAKAYARMWPPSLKRSIWLCSQDVIEQLLMLALNVADGNTHGTTVAPPGWLTAMQMVDTPGGGNGDGVQYKLLGRPLFVTEKMPAIPASGTGIDGALTLVDPTYYLVGDRQAMQVATSSEYKFQNDVVAYRITLREDGRFWLRSPLTPANGSSNTLSPLVKVGATHS